MENLGLFLGTIGIVVLIASQVVFVASKRSYAVVLFGVGCLLAGAVATQF